MSGSGAFTILHALHNEDADMTTSSDQGFPRWLILLGALTAIGPLSIDMYLPAFPQIERSLGGLPGSVELTLASFFIGLTFGQLFYGPLSDRFGRKKPLYAGLAIYTLASIGAAFAPLVAPANGVFKGMTEKDGWLIQWQPIKAGRKVKAVRFTFMRDPQGRLL